MPKNNDKEICCSFCGKSQDEVTRLVEGRGVYICDSCIDFCASLLFEDEANVKGAKKKESKEFVLPKPQEIKAQLDQYVIGQDEAKRTLAVAVYNHYKRVFKTLLLYRWNARSSKFLYRKYKFYDMSKAKVLADRLNTYDLFELM